MKRSCLSLMVVVLAAALAQGAAPPAEAPALKGKVETVTLYRGQALVTRAVPVAGAAGRLELVVAELPSQVQPDSLFAEGSNGVEVRAVRFRQRAVGEEPREEVRKIDQEVELVQDKVAANKKRQDLLTQRLAYLAKLDEFTAVTAKADLARGVLNYEALEKTSQFSFKQRDDIVTESLKLDGEARELAKQLSLLQRRRGELTAGATRTLSEAIVFLEKRGPEAGSIKLSYVVAEAGWAPAYNFRSTKDGKTVRVEYNALVHQMSGEDWNGVTLTLSTASPAIAAQGPGLAPFRVALGQLQEPQARGDVGGKFRAAQLKRSEAGQKQGAASNLRDNRAFNWDMNAAANDVQWAEVAAGKDVLDLLRGEPAVAEGPSISYPLQGTVSLASRSDQQMLRIADMELPSRFYHMATPVLASYVYREAELTNNGAEALLGGPVSVYLDGRFVGRGELPTVANGETFVMGFGADPQLRARRELVDKSEAFQGANREISIKYRLVLENYKDTAVKVRLLDRVPHPENKMDIRVTLGEMVEKLSADPLYIRLEQPKGILRWDVDVPASAAGEKAKTVDYSYKMEFPRTLDISTPAPAKAMELQKEFDQMQERRMLH